MSELTFWSTKRLAAALRAGRVSAVEALDAHLAQVEQRNPALNAIVSLDVERARARAREADEALAHGEVWGDLHGVPFALKDAHATAGLRTTVGTPVLDHVPRFDGTVAARLKGAGAILFGKTNVPPFLADYQTNSPIFGRTNNPWDLARTPGGSSGGGAAAVAAGMTPFDIATDLSGSIRVPAHFCGLFGFKPTEKRVSLDGVVPNPRGPSWGVRVMACVGPMTRAVEDLKLLYRIIAGPDGRDTEVPPVPVGPTPKLELGKLRIAFAPALPGLPVASDVREALEGVARSLGKRCAVFEEAPLPALDFPETLRSAGALIGMAVGAASPSSDGPPPTLGRYFEALHRREQCTVAWEPFFENWDALLCPVAMTGAFEHCQPGTPLPLDDTTADYWQISAYATLFSYTGHPAVALPYMRNRAGLPIGVQLVGKRWSDERLLAIATAVTSVTGDFHRPRGY